MSRTRPAVDGVCRREDPSHANAASRRLGVGATLLTFLAYLPGVDRPLFYDEAQTVGFFIVDGSPFDALRRQRLFNNHPLLSFVDNLLVQITGRSDEWILRLPPLAFAAVAVGLLVLAVQSRWGTVPAIVAGSVLASNPMFVHYGRAVRGYSLLVLAAIGSTVLLLQALRSSTDRSRLGYVVVAVTGMLTHLFMAPVLLIHAIEVLRRRAVDRRWVWTWTGIALLTGLFYAPTIPKLWTATEKVVTLDGSAISGDESAFFATLGLELLGGSRVSAAVLGLVTCTGIVLLRRSTLTTTIAVASSIIALTAWVAAPENTGPRFFLWLVPAVAVAAAAAARRHPVLVGIAVLASTAGSVSVFAGDYMSTHSTYPDIAQIVDDAAAADMRVCVSDLSVPPLLAYTRGFEPIVDPLDITRCDLLAIAAPDLDGEFVDAARTHFGDGRAVGRGLVFRAPAGLVRGG